MQRQRQEERESFQQAQRQYSSLPRYSTHLHSVLPKLPWLLHLTHGGQRGTAVDGRGCCLASRPSYYGKKTRKKAVSGHANIIT